MWTAIVGAIIGLISIGVNIYQNRQLTGAQNQANEFTASMQEDAQSFNADQARINRQWEEEQYLKYNSPSAQIRQFQEAGINPAMAFGGFQPAPASASSASSGSSSSVSPHFSDITSGLTSLLGMIPNLLKTKSDIDVNEANVDNINKDTEKTQAEIDNIKAQTENVISLTELNHIDSEYKPMMYQIGYKLNLQQFDFNDKKFEQDIEQGYLNIKATSVAITRSWEEIKNLIEDRKLTISKTQTEDLQHALTAAQTVLVKHQGYGISLDNFQKEFKNEYRSLYNADPDASWSTQAFSFATKGAQYIESILNKVLRLK